MTGGRYPIAELEAELAPQLQEMLRWTDLAARVVEASRSEVITDWRTRIESFEPTAKLFPKEHDALFERGFDALCPFSADLTVSDQLKTASEWAKSMYRMGALYVDLAILLDRLRSVLIPILTTRLQDDVELEMVLESLDVQAIALLEIFGAALDQVGLAAAASRRAEMGTEGGYLG